MRDMQELSPTTARHRAVVARMLWNGGMVTVKRVSIAVDYINSRLSVQAWRWILLIFANFHECCISFPCSLTSDMKAARIGEIASQGITLQYIRIGLLTFSRVYVGKAKNADSGQSFSKLMAG